MRLHLPPPANALNQRDTQAFGTAVASALFPPGEHALKKRLVKLALIVLVVLALLALYIIAAMHADFT